MGWQVNSVAQLFAGTTVMNATGLFVYSGTPAAGNPPIFWVTNPNVTADPYGNTVSGSGFGTPTSSRVQFDQFGEMAVFNSSDQLTLFLQPGKEAFLIYTPPAASGTLAESTAAAAGTDNFSNHVLSGHGTYGSTFAAALIAGALQFYIGSLSGGWTAGASISTDSSSDLVLLAASGHSVLTNNNTLDDGSGNLTTSGSITTSQGTVFLGGASASINATNFNMNPAMGIPPNYPTAGKTLAQTQAALDGLISEMQNRGMIS